MYLTYEFLKAIDENPRLQDNISIPDSVAKIRDQFN